MLKLIADGLAVDRGGRRVFAALSFSLQAGHALVVTGPNGVGKSSLLRTIAGLVSPAEGRLFIEDGRAEYSVAEHCHYFGHQDALKPSLTVMENLAFWQVFFGTDWPKESYQGLVSDPMAVLDRLGIAHTANLPAAYLSAGQRRRLSLSRLLVSPRPVWLLDEPTSALDAASEQELLVIMREHLAVGGAIITATHTKLDLPSVMALHMEVAQ